MSPIRSVSQRAIASALHREGDFAWYLLTDTHRESTAYVITALHALGKQTPHKCGYLNLNRADWVKSDPCISFKFMHDITYEGVAASWMLPPSEVLRAMPIQLESFWIGKDWMGRENPQPSDDDILSSLAITYAAILDVIHG